MSPLKEEMRRGSGIFQKAMLWLTAAAILCQAGLTAAEDLDMTAVSIENLMTINVTSVSKKDQKLSDSAAAIFVITNEDLKHSGAASIPEALRMAPGVDVARIDANKWAVSIRGFNNRFSDKLLVLIDGRTVYTPSFSGVFWEVQDVMLEDVDRIEVIRGPGATIWGANAVNGVINIITKHAAGTLGGLAVLGGGDEERGFAALRYGAALGESTFGRIYAKGFKRDSFMHAAGGDAGDDWRMLQSGFRVDSSLNVDDSLTLQGDVYHGDINQNLYDLPTLTPPYRFSTKADTEVSGANLIARWERILSPTARISLQAYYDGTERKEIFSHERRNSVDIEFQHQFAAGSRHAFIWGGRYRYTQDDSKNTFIISVDPDSRQDNLFSCFIQDEMSLVPERMALIVGSKIEYNDYSGLEIQPSARLFWAPYRDHKLWAAVSRAVRTPSRLDSDGRVTSQVIPPSPSGTPLPVAVGISGNPDFESEEVVAYELGYRFLAAGNLSLDAATFYNDYDKLRRFVPVAPIFKGIYIDQPLETRNEISAGTYGVEAAAAWQPALWLKFDLAYTWLRADVDDGGQFGRDPHHQVSLRTTFKPRADLDLDVWVRYGDNSASYFPPSADGLYPIDRYTAVDLRLAWRLNADIEIALVGQNLFDPGHLEFVQEGFVIPTEVERGCYGKLTWRF